jgi:NADH-quinone oxidoreductase subunit J
MTAEAAINWQTFFFLLFAAVACIFAVAVVISANVVRMAFYLIISLGATSGLFFAAGADFVGAMQLLIYVGGTLVLLVFGVMLTAQAPFVSMKTRGGEWIMAAILGGSLLAVLVQRIVTVSDWYGPVAARQPSAEGTHVQPASFAGREHGESHPNRAVSESTPDVVLQDARTATRIGLALSGPRVDKLDQPNPVLRQGMSSYLLPFEIVSVHLLVVLIGAAYLARAKKRATANA